MATIKEVAKEAGLSVSTVSRYLNDHPYISEEKRKRIKAAMEELDYTPSSIATQLRSKKGTMIGILVSRITNPFFSYLVDSIENYAKEQGYNVLIMQTYDDENAEFRMLELLKQQVIAGLVMCSVESKPFVIEPYQDFGPIVLCNEQISESTLPQVFTDQEKATYEGISYLIKKGYRKIAYCSGGNLTQEGHGTARTNGFEKAMLENNLSVKARWIFKQVHTIQDGQQIAKDIFSMPKDKRPEAIFTNSDEIASGILEEVIVSGKKVPDDLAILGFDNQPFTAMLAVPLTTINQPVEALGKESIKLLIAKLKNQEYQIDRSDLLLELIIRKSA